MLNSNLSSQKDAGSKSFALINFSPWGFSQKGLVVLALALVVLGASGCSGTDYRADEDWEKLGRFTYPGFYVGAGFSRAIEDYNIDLVSADDSDSGFHLKAGLRGSRYLALEFMYERGSFDLSAGGSKFAVAEMNSFSLNMKYFPTGGFEGNMARVQPYLLGGFGAAYLNTNDDVGFDTGNDSDAPIAKVGLGADVYLTENVYLNGEVVRTEMFDRLQDYDFTSLNIGINVRF